MLLTGFQLLQEGITVRSIDAFANLGPHVLLSVVSHMGHACWLASQLNFDRKASGDACIVWSTRWSTMSLQVLECHEHLTFSLCHQSQANLLQVLALLGFDVKFSNIEWCTPKIGAVHLSCTDTQCIM